MENQEAPRSPSPTPLPSLQEVTRTSTPPGSQWQSPRGGPPAAAAYGDGYAQPHYGAPEPVPTLYPLLYATARLLQHLRDSAVGGCDAQQRAAIARLVAAGDSMLSRVRDAEAVRGRGFGCGGLGSGVAHVPPSTEPPGGGAARIAVGAAAIVPQAQHPAGSGPLAPPAAAAAFPAAREFILRLVDDGQLTPDAGCPPHEQQRRAAVRRTRLCADVLVNGRFVARSPPAPLAFPGFTATLSFSMALRVFRRPTSIAVTVADVSSPLWSALLGPTPLATVLVPVPGGVTAARRTGAGGGGGGGPSLLPSAAVLPVSGHFEFSESVPMRVQVRWRRGRGQGVCTRASSYPRSLLLCSTASLRPSPLAAAWATACSPQATTLRLLPAPLCQGRRIPSRSCRSRRRDSGASWPTGRSLVGR